MDESMSGTIPAEQERGRLGKSAVITGASSGIGRATAMEFARRGWDVVIASRQPDVLKDLAGELREGGSGVLALRADVTDPGQVRQLAEKTVERFGSLDVWVNNAAVGVLGPFEEVPEEDFRQVIETDLMGYIHGTRVALKRFRNRGTARS